MLLIIVLRWYNVWFQKISIPPPRREFHLGPPSSPDFPFFEVSCNPPIPPDFPQFVKHPPTPLESFVQEASVKNEATDPNLSEAKPFRLS